MPNTDTVRVRFAPSPTGYLHVGGARTAIFNWLFARHHGGQFVLRIEDTDAERSTRESEESLIRDLEWLGLDWDEGPGVEGPHAPYRQSERLDIYRTVLDDFISRDLAYPCFCSDELLEQKRKDALARGLSPHYDGTCRDLTPRDVAAKRSEGLAEVIRFKVPVDIVAFDDVVRGPMDLATSMVGDFVLIRSNGLPTYNFVAAVDDTRMGITHVIRAEEHLSNTLRQVLIYNALGVDYPVFAHVPLILGEDRSKLSKRHGATSVEGLRNAGVLADAAVNYLVLLGWSHPQEREVLSRDEMVEAFTIERVGKTAAVFDPTKLAWMNGQHIRGLEPDALFELAAPFLPESITARYDEAARREIVAALGDHIGLLSDLPGQAAVFLDEVEYEDDALEVVRSDTSRAVLTAFRGLLGAHTDPLTPEAFKQLAKATGKDVGAKGKELFFPLRAAITGNVHGPDLSRIAAVKGRGSILGLVDAALAK